MFELPIIFLIAACLTIAIAAAIQTAMGFGLVLIAVPILLLIEPAMVPAPVVMVAFVQSSVAIRLYWADIQWSLIKIAIIGRLPGTAVAMLLMIGFDQSGLKIFIAAGVLLAVLLSLLKLSAQPNRKNHLIAGFFSGLMGTTSGIGGPPIALLYQHQHGDIVRANLSAYFFIGSAMSLSAMGLVGYINLTSWLYAALFVPSTFIGVWLGFRLKKYLAPTFMRPAILLSCSVSATAVIITTLF